MQRTDGKNFANRLILSAVFTIISITKSYGDNQIIRREYRIEPDNEESLGFWVRDPDFSGRIGTFHISFQHILEGKPFESAVLTFKNVRDRTIAVVPLFTRFDSNLRSTSFSLTEASSTNTHCVIIYGKDTDVQTVVEIHLMQYTKACPYQTTLDIIFRSEAARSTSFSLGAGWMQDCIARNDWKGALSWMAQLQPKLTNQDELGRSALSNLSSRVQQFLDIANNQSKVGISPTDGE